VSRLLRVAFEQAKGGNMYNTFLMMAVLITVLGLGQETARAQAGGPNEAEKLFRDMEKKLASAKTMEVAFDAKVEGGQGAQQQGTLLFASGNKCYLEMSGNLGSKNAKAVMISDGAKMITSDGAKILKVHDVPKDLTDRLRASISRTGFLFAWFFSTKGPDDKQEFRIDEDYKVSDFVLVKKEKIGDQEAQVIRYALALPETNYSISVSVWLNVKNNLPLKRVTTIKGVNTGIFSETYTKLALDPDLDLKKFELPKK
jgi:outer membrane lipoprotein-sorting protein